MSFFDTTRPDNSGQFRKVEFLELPQGQTIIRIIDTPQEAQKHFIHYVKGVYIMCLGEDCPVCANNRKLISENPETFRDIAGYSPRSERFVVNVLDKTPVKICKNCSTPNKGVMGNFTAICSKCERPIVDVQPQPLNKIKVLAKGKTLADQLNAIDASIQDKDTGNPVGINNFDLGLFVQGSGRTQTITVIPMVDKREPVNLEGLTKFDLTKSTLKLSVEEITDLQKGISLKDILTARGLSKADKELSTVSKEVGEAIKADVAKIMGE